MRLTKGLLLAILLFCANGLAHADVPTTINVQGRLADTNGVAVADALWAATVVIYDSASGGNVLWSGEALNLQTKSGYFNAVLGKINAISPSVFSKNCYLGITLSGDTSEMSPRLQIHSAPSALQVPDGSISRNKLIAGAVGTTTIASGAVMGGNIGGNTITASNIANATITGNKIASATIGGSNIASATVTGGNIANATITNANIANGAIDTQAKAPLAPIVNGGINSPKIAYGNATTNGSGSATVSLASYGFTTTPAITCTVVTGSYICRAIMVSSQSNTQFSVSVSDDTNNHNWSENFNWIAVGY